MIFFLKNSKSNKLKTISHKLNKGMSIVELLVVLSIFVAISGVAIFNFGNFQGQVDIRNLASDIALKTVEAQKASLSGQFPPIAQGTPALTWKPSYGIYFNTTSDNKSFIYFVDLGAENGLYDASSCPGTGECLEQVTITKGNYISSLKVYYTDSTNASLNDLTITFQRPNSTAVLKSSGIAVPPVPAVSYVQITISSPKSPPSTALIKVYPSGRMQVN